ncbi:hypothetical protein K438DRAFT_1786977 [Mycena galopus ATCC 62051]|nr:hypothetical protein K438DRAFT_1786977 [Mycena galopus ATCC 62051]
MESARKGIHNALIGSSASNVSATPKFTPKSIPPHGKGDILNGKIRGRQDRVVVGAFNGLTIECAQRRTDDPKTLFDIPHGEYYLRGRLRTVSGGPQVPVLEILTAKNESSITSVKPVQGKTKGEEDTAEEDLAFHEEAASTPGSIVGQFSC